VLADSLYGESGDMISILERLNLPFIVAIRSNHGVLVALLQKVRYNRWRAYIQPLSHRQPETLQSAKLSLAKYGRCAITRISKTDSPTTKPLETWFIMTNLPKSFKSRSTLQ
jgi:SRSO17 transposase